MSLTLERRREALTRFERAVELPLFVAAALLVPLLLAPLLVDLPEAVKFAFTVLDIIIWAMFVVEYVVRLYLTPDGKWRFVRHQWADLAVIAVPFLRPLRVLRLLRVVAALNVVGKEGHRLLVRHQFHYALLVVAVVIVGGAALGLAFEQQSGGTINSYGDSLWWALTTVTTVGYGETFPVTTPGRVVAVVLMVTGITLFGLLTANLATFLLERGKVNQERPTGDLQAVLERLDRLEGLLREERGVR